MHGLPAGARLPRAMEARRLHRHVLLPPARPQRDRRAVLHPAHALPQDRGPSPGLGHLHRAAGRRGHASPPPRATRSRRSIPPRSRRTSRRPRRARPARPPSAGRSPMPFKGSTAHVPARVPPHAGRRPACPPRRSSGSCAGSPTVPAELQGAPEDQAPPRRAAPRPTGTAARWTGASARRSPSARSSSRGRPCA